MCSNIGLSGGIPDFIKNCFKFVLEVNLGGFRVFNCNISPSSSSIFVNLCNCDTTPSRTNGVYVYSGILSLTSLTIYRAVLTVVASLDPKSSAKNPENSVGEIKVNNRSLSKYKSSLSNMSSAMLFSPLLTNLSCTCKINGSID